MVRDEARMLPRWLDHYGRQVGVENLVVLDDNSTDGSTEGLPCTVIHLPPLTKKEFEPARMGLVSGIAAGLLEGYDAVLFTDADEFLVADPKKYAGLRELLADRPGVPVLGAINLNLVHDVAREPALDDSRPVFEQRRLAKFMPLMCKPAVKRIPAPWAHASHGIFAPYAVDRDLYMFHLKFADRELLRAAAEHRQQMVAMDGRADATSWRYGGDAMVELLDRVNEALDRSAVRNFRPPLRRLHTIVQEQPNGMFRAVGRGQVLAMETLPFVRVPERFVGSL